MEPEEGRVLQPVPSTLVMSSDTDGLTMYSLLMDALQGKFMCNCTITPSVRRRAGRVMSTSTAPKGKVTPVGGVAAIGREVREPPVTSVTVTGKEEVPVVGATVVVVEVAGCMS